MIGESDKAAQDLATALEGSPFTFEVSNNYFAWLEYLGDTSGIRTSCWSMCIGNIKGNEIVIGTDSGYTSGMDIIARGSSNLSISDNTNSSEYYGMQLEGFPAQLEISGNLIVNSHIGTWFVVSGGLILHT